MAPCQNTRIIRMVRRYTRSPWSHGGMRYRLEVLQRPCLALQIFAVHALHSLENKAENEHARHRHCLRAYCPRDQYQHCKGPDQPMQIEPMLTSRKYKSWKLTSVMRQPRPMTHPGRTFPRLFAGEVAGGVKVCPKTPADQWETHVFEVGQHLLG